MTTVPLSAAAVVAAAQAASASASPPPRPAQNPPPPSANAMPPSHKAPTICVMGDPGSGKTTSIITLLEAEIHTFIVVTDPNGIDAILDAIRRDPKTRQPRSKQQAEKLLSFLHWSNMSPAPAGWSALKEMASAVHMHSYQALADMKTGIGKQHINIVTSLVELLNDFVCDRTGEHYGDVTTWGDDHALIFDSLSGINKLCKEHTAGYKPSLHMGEWGIAMNLEEQIIFKVVSDCQCWVIVMAHLDKVPNEVTGIPNISLAALGNKLAPQLLKNFSEVVYAKVDGKGKYAWSTLEPNMTLKHRALDASADLPPSFAPIVAIHKLRKESL